MSVHCTRNHQDNCERVPCTLCSRHGAESDHRLTAGMAAQMAQAQAYATYLVELAMLDYSMLCYTYSMVAAGAVVAANRLLGRADDCPHALQKHCGYTRDELLPCARDLAQLHSKSAPFPPALLPCPPPPAPRVRHTCWDGGRHYIILGRSAC